MGGVTVETKLFRCDEQSSYVELLGKDLEKCLYCEKSTQHDHDIFGKIKFHPRDSRAFISLIVSDKNADKTDGQKESIGAVLEHVSLQEKSSRNDYSPSDIRDLITQIKEGVLIASKEKQTLLTTFKSKSSALDLEIPPPTSEDSERSFCCLSEDGSTRLSPIREHFSSRHGVIFREVAPIKQVECGICLGAFKDENSLKKHSALHTEDQQRRFVCQICSKRFLKASHLESHQLHHSGNKPFGCPSCPNKYTSEFALRNHRIHAHNEGVKPACKDCGKTFFTNSSARKHGLRFHARDSRLVCPTCSRVYLRRDNLERHMRSAHPQRTSHEPIKEAFEHEEVAFDCEEGSRRGITLNSEVLNISGGLDASATEALLKNLTPQPDYLLKSLTPIPLEALEEMLLSTN